MKRLNACIAGIVALAALPAIGAPPVNTPPLLPVPLPVTAPNPLPVTAPDPLPVVDAENPARSPYVGRASFRIEPGLSSKGPGIGAFPTPAGKGYVIEYVAVWCFTSSATDTFRPRLRITKQFSDTIVSFDVLAVQMQSEGFNPTGVAPVFSWNGAAQVKLYSDAGPSEQGITLEVFHSDTTAEANCQASVHGYTVGL